MSDVPFPTTQLVNQVRQQYPQMWERLKKKVYKNVENFNDYRVVYADHLMPVIAAMNDADPYGIGNSLIKSTLQDKYEIPIFFIAPELLAAARMSSVNFTIEWEHMRLPFPSFNIVLPKGSLFINGEEVLFLDVTRVTRTQQRSLAKHLPPTQRGRLNALSAQFIINATTDQTAKYTKFLTTPYDPKSSGGSLLSGSLEMNLSESEAVSRLPDLIFNILFAMAARPEYVERGTRISVHKKSGSEIWSPNIIGRKYAVKRSGDAQGTHASPRMHWRRGHFRHQPFGKGLTETKVIWLEPTLIGVKEK